MSALQSRLAHSVLAMSSPPARLATTAQQPSPAATTTAHSTANGTANGKAAAIASDRPDAPLFSFGVCSDVQYADLPEGKSHGGTARFYRDSLAGLQRAVAGWSARGVDFGMHLGDIIDG